MSPGAKVDRMSRRYDVGNASARETRVPMDLRSGRMALSVSDQTGKAMTARLRVVLGQEVAKKPLHPALPTGAKATLLTN